MRLLILRLTKTAALIFMLVCSWSAMAETCPPVAGWLEEATIAATPGTLKAKLDTGAQTSSLDAREVTPFMRDGAAWIRFRSPALEGAGGLTGSQSQGAFEAPLVRWTKVRRAETKVGRRPVVSLTLCVAGVTGPAEVTLADRSGMDAGLLVGRQFLAGRIAVDSARTEIAGGLCGRK